MARTDKDRPWRMRETDPTEFREAFHDHLSFGKELYRHRRVRDTNGEIVTEVKIYKGWKPGVGYVNVEHVVAVYEKIFIGHVLDHCSLDESLTGAYDHRHWLLPCSYTVRSTQNWRGTKSYVKTFHSHSKTSERAALTRARGLFNSADLDEWDDFDDAPEFSKRGRFTRKLS